jgi:hypothetical protein
MQNEDCNYWLSQTKTTVLVPRGEVLKEKPQSMGFWVYVLRHDFGLDGWPWVC